MDDLFKDIEKAVTVKEKKEDVVFYSVNEKNEDPFAFVSKNYSAKQASYTKTKVTRYVQKSD